MMLFKKLLRTAWHYKAQFISMILMVAIGIGIFVGFNMEWKSIEVGTNDFFAETGYSDYRIYNTSATKPLGFSLDDINNLKSDENIISATRYFSNVIVNDVNKKYDDKNYATLDFCVIEDYGNPTKLSIISGSEYDKNSDGFYLSDKYAKIYGYNVGDSITVSYSTYSITKPIKALVKSGEHLICVNQDNQQLMPDYSVYGFIYATPNILVELLGVEIYPCILVKSDLSTSKFSEIAYKYLGESITIVDKDNDVNYSESRGEISEGITMGNFLPIIFLAIAILTMITTMHRITVNERTQIGTLKALGFKDRRILIHYTSYGLFIGLVGSILGIILGIFVCFIIMNPNGFMGTYFDMVSWPLVLPVFTIYVMVGMIILFTLITYLSVKKVLSLNAAESLRPASPKTMKTLVVEKTKLFEKLSFRAKWNLRDIFRNKIRTLMTLVGIVGATMLLVATFSFKYTFDGYLNDLKNKIVKYETQIILNNATSNIDALNLATTLDADYMSYKSIKLNDSNEYIGLQIVNNDKNLYGIIDENSKEFKLSNDGIYVSKRVAKDGIKIGDIVKLNITIDNINYTYEANVAGYFMSYSTKSVLASFKYIENLKSTDNKSLDYEITNIYTSKTKNEVEALKSSLIKTITTKTELFKTYDSFTELMNTFIAILVIASVLLAVVVLYNLGVMGYFERYRQLATLKVVGFKDKAIGKILVSQNIWLTLVGIIIGIPLGLLILNVLIILLVADYEITVIFGISAFIIPIVLVFATSLLVSLFISTKNKKIDMVEALKGVD